MPTPQSAQARAKTENTRYFLEFIGPLFVLSDDTTYSKRNGRNCSISELHSVDAIASALSIREMEFSDSSDRTAGIRAANPHCGPNGHEDDSMETPGSG